MTKRRQYFQQLICPHPDCNHLCSFLTKVHCRTHHNIEKSELIEKYGEPEPVQFEPKKLGKNQKIKTIYGDQLNS